MLYFFFLLSNSCLTPLSVAFQGTISPARNACGPINLSKKQGMQYRSEDDEGHFSWNNLADSEIVCIFAEQYSRDYGKKKVSCGYSDFLATEA